MLSLPRFGHFLARKMATGKSDPPSGTLLDFLLVRDRHSLLELFWKNSEQPACRSVKGNFPPFFSANGVVKFVLPALLQKLVGEFFLIFRRENWKT